jgi:hypothetical protein
MTKFLHRLSILLYFTIVIAAFGILVYFGRTYYKLPIGERPFHEYYELLKPSGFIGHGLGIIGTLLIVTGLFGYMARKRLSIFSGIGVLKYWLELHIFLCTLGAVFVLFHTTFKFGGIISIGFWSLVVVWMSGVIGRFLYIQMPRNIEGRELTLLETQNLREELDNELFEKYNLKFSEVKTSRISKIRLKLISNKIPKNDFQKAFQLIRKERKLLRRIERLELIKNLFKYWHFAHLPFALIMLIIMLIHVGVTLFFGYKWIF